MEGKRKKKKRESGGGGKKEEKEAIGRVGEAIGRARVPARGSAIKDAGWICGWTPLLPPPFLPNGET